MTRFRRFRRPFHRLVSCWPSLNYTFIYFAMTGDPSQVLASHLISQIRSSLSVLEQLNVIQVPDADTIRSKLPPPNGPFPALASPAQAFSNMTIASPPPALPQRIQQPEARGRAIWDYAGNVGRALIELTTGSRRFKIQSRRHAHH